MKNPIPSQSTDVLKRNEQKNGKKEIKKKKKKKKKTYDGNINSTDNSNEGNIVTWLNDTIFKNYLIYQIM